MQQLTVTLPDNFIHSLEQYCRAKATTPAEVVTSMIAALPKEEENPQPVDIERILRETRGAWKSNPDWQTMDAVDYQRKIRAEWDNAEDDWG